LTNLWVKGKDGKDVDIVLGYDDAAYYGQLSPPRYDADWT